MGDPFRRYWKPVARWGFALNAAWEFSQCLFLYGMWSWGFWRATAWMWAAIFGDVLIVLGVAALAGRLVGRKRLAPPTWRGWAALLLVGFAAAVFLEWAAQVISLWEYSALMPTLQVLGHTVGLAPVAQITLLPAASVYLATRNSAPKGIAIHK
jgi:hypothetical protein